MTPDTAPAQTRHSLAPGNLLVAAILIALALAGAMIVFAAQPGWLGLKLVYDAPAGGARVISATGPGAHIPAGTILTRIGDGRESVTLTARDFVAEPAGAIPTYDEHREFLARQGQLSRIQGARRVTVTDAGGHAWQITPNPLRPLSSLPVEFWVQIFVGVVAWMVSSAIWVFRRGETSARYLLLSGFSTLVFAPFAAVYSTRELGLDPLLFRVLNDLNFLGGSLFCASLVALLLYYPRILAPRWVGWTLVATFIAWWVAQEVDVFQSMTIARRLLVMIGVASTFVIAAIHWRGTRADPVARAALQWFLLSWLLGISLFTTIIFVPQMAGVDTSSLQGYSFLLFLLVYGGLAFGILRFRLFELGEWWVRIMVWTVSILVLVLLDLLLVLVLEMSSGVSLALSLAACGILWLPLRGWLWGMVLGRSNLDERARFQGLTDVAFATSDEEQAKRWAQLLRRIFDPLHIGPGSAAAAGLTDDGLALQVPGVETLAPLRLEYKRGGARLFNRADANLVQDLAAMLGHVIRDRNAYQKGVEGERRRIASDIHDNLGASLLNALRSQDGERKNALIRETLSDLRSIVTDSSAPGTTLDEALAPIRRETGDRLEASGITLDWPLEELAHVTLSSALVHTLRSIIREAVTNVIKHAEARRVTVAVAASADAVLLVIRDDGKGFEADAVPPGHGLANIQRRTQARGGDLSWQGGVQGGTELSVRLPLAESAATAS